MRGRREPCELLSLALALLLAGGGMQGCGTSAKPEKQQGPAPPKAAQARRKAQMAKNLARRGVGRTSLREATIFGRTDDVRRLLAEGADTSNDGSRSRKMASVLIMIAP